MSVWDNISPGYGSTGGNYSSLTEVGEELHRHSCGEEGGGGGGGGLQELFVLSDPVKQKSLTQELCGLTEKEIQSLADVILRDISIPSMGPEVSQLVLGFE